MFVDELKLEIKKLTKAKETVKKEVLKLLLSEIQTDEARSNKSVSDDACVSIVKKFLKLNREAYEYADSQETKRDLDLEKDALSAFLPKVISFEQMQKLLTQDVVDSIKNSKSDGQAIGLTIKHLKSTGLSSNNIDNNDVKQLVISLRA